MYHHNIRTEVRSVVESLSLQHPPGDAISALLFQHKTYRNVVSVASSFKLPRNPAYGLVVSIYADEYDDEIK